MSQGWLARQLVNWLVYLSLSYFILLFKYNFQCLNLFDYVIYLFLCNLFICYLIYLLFISIYQLFWFQFLFWNQLTNQNIKTSQLDELASWFEPDTSRVWVRLLAWISLVGSNRLGSYNCWLEFELLLTRLGSLVWTTLNVVRNHSWMWTVLFKELMQSFAIYIWGLWLGLTINLIRMNEFSIWQGHFAFY
jgi:hypothetical protein